MPTKSSKSNKADAIPILELLESISKKEAMVDTNQAVTPAPTPTPPQPTLDKTTKVAKAAKPVKQMTRQEYRKLPTRVKRRLGNLKPTLDVMQPTADNFKLFLRDVTEAYYSLGNYCVKFPKNEKNNFSGLAPMMLRDMNKILELATEIEQYNPETNRERLLRRIAVKLYVLRVKTRMTSRIKYMTAKRRKAIVTRLTKLETVTLGLALGLQRAREHKHESK